LIVSVVKVFALDTRTSKKDPGIAKGGEPDELLLPCRRPVFAEPVPPLLAPCCREYCPTVTEPFPRAVAVAVACELVLVAEAAPPLLVLWPLWQLSKLAGQGGPPKEAAWTEIDTEAVSDASVGTLESVTVARKVAVPACVGVP